jgi:cell division protein FtsZ
MVQLNRQYGGENNTDEPVLVKVVGVGGAGSNILDRVMLDGIEAADMVAINTDVQSLTASVAAHKVQIGRNLTRGLGSGGDPELGYAAAEEATDEIRSVIQGGTVIFVCSGLGGGTGSGAAPYVVQIAKEENALVLGVVALPFSFEGRRRCAQAEESLTRLRSVCDAVVCFENDRMAEITLPRMGIHEAFAAADLTISQSIRSVTGILQRPGLLHIGFDDVCTVLRNGDARALFGYGEAEGENRAHDALAKALKNPLMNRGALLEETFHAIVHICGGANVTLGEVQIIMEELNRHINDHTQLFMGVGIEPRMGNRLSVSILSSLGNGAERPPAQTVQRTARVVQPETNPKVSDIKPDPWQPTVPLNPAPSKPVAQELPHRVAPVERTPERAPDELMLPPAETESPRPASVRQPVAKSEPKPLTPAPAKPQTAAPGKKTEAKQETLQFEPVSRGRFEKSEPTIIDGQDLDVPTFLRKNVKVR